MQIGIITFVLSAVLSILFYLLLKNTAWAKNTASPWLRYLAICFIILGAACTFHFSNLLQAELSMRDWPTTEGEIIASFIAEKPIYQPRIRYIYSVGNQNFTTTSDLKTPAFGGKNRRHKTSEIVLSDYPVGKTIIIHYNPENPGISAARIAPKFSHFIMIFLGAMLLVIGTVLMMKKVDKIIGKIN